VVAQVYGVNLRRRTVAPGQDVGRVPAPGHQPLTALQAEALGLGE
jgi:hypothetical protein